MAYEQETQEVENYYADLLILQYRNKPRARATIKLGTDIYLADGLIFQLNDVLDIDIAVGAQLDLIGKILNCPRNVAGIQVDTKFFSFHIDENSLGFSTIGNPSDGVAKTRRLSNLSIYSLPDDQYRKLLKFKALSNVLTGTMAGIDEALYRTFGDTVRMINNQDLSITYVVSEMDAATEAAIKLGYLRAPNGVAVNFQTD